MRRKKILYVILSLYCIGSIISFIIFIPDMAYYIVPVEILFFGFLALAIEKGWIGRGGRGGGGGGDGGGGCGGGGCGGGGGE
jgi:hypothetical protein